MTAKRPRVSRSSTTSAPDYYTVERYEDEDSIGYMMAAVRTRMFEVLDVEMSRVGFTAAQWPILRAVAHGTPTAAELCRVLNYDTGSMTRMLNRLEEKGLIRRVPSRKDRRIVELQITPTGRRLYPKLRGQVIRVLNQLLIGLNPAEIRQAHRLVKHMLENLGPK
jgi:DNA-binding MarR family transcriptional regulator